MNTEPVAHAEPGSELEELRRRVAKLEAVEQERDQLREQLASLLVHKHAVEAVGREQARAQLYLDMASVILVVLDQDGNILQLNRKGHMVLGYPDGDLLGDNWFDTCIPEASREDLRARFRRLVSGNPEQFQVWENEVLTRSGTTRLIAWENRHLVDSRGRPTGSISSGIDITDYRRTEEALRQAQAELERRQERTAELREANARLTRELEGRQRVRH